MPEEPRREGVFIPQWAVMALSSMLPIGVLCEWIAPAYKQWDALIAMLAALAIGIIGWRRERRRLRETKT